MTDVTIGFGTECQWIVHWIPRSTPGPSLIEVSNVVSKESGVNGLCIFFFGMVTTMVKDNDFTHCCVC